MKKYILIFLFLIAGWTGAYAQDKVHGVVTDKNDEPLVGVFVYIKGSTKGVQTNLDGIYEIAAPAKGKSYTLCFQYLGMISQEIEVRQQRRLNVTMQPDNELDAVMIVGAYGTKQRREDLVGSAFQVNADDLKDKPKLRVESLLEGMVPGMSVEANVDAASTDKRINIRIRGDASLSASNEPMWIIDGVPVYTGDKTNQMPGMSHSVSPLSYLDPDDIESITVLKDADQTTIYGANGANGVILVTTKSAAKNSPLRVSANVVAGVAAPDYSTMFKVMNARQYMEVAKEAWTNSGYAMSDFPFQDNDMNNYSTTSTDWARQYLGIGNDVYARLNLQSGSKRISSNISASYYLMKNIVKKDDQQRIVLNSRQKLDLWKGASLGFDLQGSYNITNIFSPGKSYLDVLPIYEPYTADGEYRLYNKKWDMTKHTWVTSRFTNNEIPSREEDDNVQRTLQSKANINFHWEIIKGLQLTSIFGFDYTHSHEDTYSSMKTLNGQDWDTGEKLGYSSRADASYLRWTNSNVLRYSTKIAQKHGIEVYGGFELLSQQNKMNRVSGSGFSNDNIKELAYASKISDYSSSNTTNKRSMSYFGRISYSYDSRYYLSANFRRDGDSGFGKYSKWATFWSVGASWNIHKETWFNADFMRMLKLKASYGTSGNSRVDSSSAEGTYSYGESYSYLGEMGAVIGTVPNPGLSWESKKMLNVGIRAEFNNIIDIEIEAYRNETKDLLSKMYVSRTITEDSVYGNVGRLLNMGVELSLHSYNILRKNFTWTTTFNLAHNTNRILEMYNGVTRSFGSTVWMVGYDRNTYCLVRWAGVDPSTGAPMWYDVNGNLTHTYDYANRVVDTRKNFSPILDGSLINNISWMNLSLSFQINYSIGGYALATYASNYFNDGYAITGGNQAVEVYYLRWTTPGQVAAFPKVSELSTKSGMNSTRFLYDKTYFNLSNISLSYRLPRRWIDTMKLSDFTLSFICNNVYLLTPDQFGTVQTNYGPVSKSQLNSYRTMKSGYPQTRTFSLGINVSF